MQYENTPVSQNIEDRRGQGGGGGRMKAAGASESSASSPCSP